MTFSDQQEEQVWTQQGRQQQTGSAPEEQEEGHNGPDGVDLGGEG